jgi:hypothetical protein
MVGGGSLGGLPLPIAKPAVKANRATTRTAGPAKLETHLRFLMVSTPSLAKQVFPCPAIVRTGRAGSNAIPAME